MQCQKIQQLQRSVNQLMQSANRPHTAVIGMLNCAIMLLPETGQFRERIWLGKMKILLVTNKYTYPHVAN